MDVAQARVVPPGRAEASTLDHVADLVAASTRLVAPAGNEIAALVIDR